MRTIARFDPSRADRMRVRREWGIADDETLVVSWGPDKKEGTTAFLEKRPAKFQGK
jgi:hypothetical protein